MDENKNNENKIIQPSDPQLNTQQPVEVNQSTNTTLSSPVSSNQFNQYQDNKPSKWRYFFVVLGILQALGVAVFFLIMFWAIQQAKAGVSGTEFIGLILFVTLVPAVGIIALINLIGLPIYMRKFKPRGKGLVLAVVSLVISVILFLYGAYSVYQLRVAVPRQIDELSEQSRKDSEQREQEFAADNANPEITKEEAIKLLQSCKLKGFYYTKEADKEHGTSPATSATGVVLTKIDGEPYRISIADRLIDELVPIAREAQKTCGGPQFWHDGRYEQFKDGSWYFKGEVVNNTQSGKTKEETISFMQDCRADYFVGYTDIGLVKDSNT